MVRGEPAARPAALSGGFDASANTAPVVTTDGTRPAPGQIVLASSLFSVADADGDPILRYEVRDDSPATGSGRFVTTGPDGDAYLRAGIASAFAPDRFAALRVDEGMVADNDGLFVRAYDGGLWSDWTWIG